MLGNLFNQRKIQPEEELPQNQPSGFTAQPVTGSDTGQGAIEPGQSTTGSVVGSRMDPAFRQNLSALSHLDVRTTQVLHHAQEEAKRTKQAQIEPDHILLGLLYDEEIFKLLEQFSVDVAQLAREVQAKEQMGTFAGQPTLSSAGIQLFEQAYREAKTRNVSFVTPEDLLLIFFNANIEATKKLQEKGVTKEQVEEKLSKSSKFSKGKKSILEQYGIDLTEEARAGKLDPITGRDKEIERLVHILLRRTKNNPIIIGEAGVGKTAIIEGVAQLIVSGNVPEELKNKRIFQLDLASLVAGASHRGEFEERLKGVINETIASAGQTILFIDEIHTLMGAGDSDGTLDASNIIKPHLARGHMQLIGTTTTA
jgi:ATP-dependent Clp protease ATP-binding subunit ClpA